MKFDLDNAKNQVDSLNNELNQYRGRLQNANKIEYQLASELNQNNDSVCSISGENIRFS